MRRANKQKRKESGRVVPRYVSLRRKQRKSCLVAQREREREREGEGGKRSQKTNPKGISCIRRKAHNPLLLFKRIYLQVYGYFLYCCSEHSPSPLFVEASRKEKRERKDQSQHNETKEEYILHTHAHIYIMTRIQLSLAFRSPSSSESRAFRDTKTRR